MRWIPLPTAVIAFLLTAAPVLAQNASKAPSPTSTMAKPWFSIVVAFFLMILVGIGSFMSSKRSHQD